MATKRFKALRTWHNTLLMVWSLPFLLLPGVILGASTGSFNSAIALGVIAIVGLLVANRRDREKRCVYLLEDETLELVDGSTRMVLKLAEITDASLIDRAAGREFFREWIGVNEPTTGDIKKRRAFYMRFCSVDIGLKSYTFGLGRSLIDRLPSAKSDLVLLRIRNGEAMLISPQQAQDLVESVGRRKFQY